MRAFIHTAWIGAVLLAAIAVAGRAGLSSYRAAASGTDAVRPQPVLVRLTAAEARNYTFRLRQLEQDLRCDETDYEVLLRLGQVNLHLAECQVEGRVAYLRRARHYLLRAGMRTMFRYDAFQIHALLDAANEPNPTFVFAGLPGDVGPPPGEDEALIRQRIGFLEEQANFYPQNSRLRRRLGDCYVSLYSVMDHSGTAGLEHWEGGSAISAPAEALQLAERSYGRAIACARTHETRCRALYREAEMYRILNDPGRAAGRLQQVLTLQPNNWLVSLEMASLCRQLGQADEAERYRALAARWRTPGWL